MLVVETAWLGERLATTTLSTQMPLTTPLSRGRTTAAFLAALAAFYPFMRRPILT